MDVLMRNKLEYVKGFYGWPSCKCRVSRLVDTRGRLYIKMVFLLQHRHERQRAQVAAIPRLGIWSGFRSWTRGRHWDRKTRYGIR